ncbi:alpha/beta hydrolase-fold protein [Algoriphagus sp. CAU 1675]|uniref:alpha/beta hydrolase-fold protein n=1 Tax=Algoriphagus sp. CAU 1675 TaxID=3032597 RepID=UPI0023DA6E36|nr:alpha/beta hydrolase-fold protein [Algoriphagus sp. CAU 1675]MDF2157116.1 alpha/beta hydrolase-fold protein [Algoriphagus sp. CAU 1675]
MRTILVILAFTFSQLSVNAQLARNIEMTPDNQLLGLGQQHLIQSEILQEERPIIVSLPNDYENSEAGYPVIYVLDGLENIKHTVGTIEILSESGLIPPMIIVGIQSLDRARDLTPSNAGQNVYGGTGNKGIPQSGGAKRFLQFISEEVFTFVEKNYRTYPYRVLEGHSFGGLFGVYTLMESPELFDAFIIEAPALWWNEEQMTQKASTFFAENQSLNKTVYLGIGGGDGWGMKQELIRYVDEIKKNQPEEFRWLHEEVGDEDHMASRLLLNYHGLKFLFSDIKLSDSLKSNFSEEEFLQGEEQLMLKYGGNVRRGANEYVNLAFEEIDKKNEKGAITILKRATQAYPKYIGMLTLLAQTYEKTGQIELAIDTYRKGIEVSKRYKLGMEDDFVQKIEQLKQSK